MVISLTKNTVVAAILPLIFFFLLRDFFIEVFFIFFFSFVFRCKTRRCDINCEFVPGVEDVVEMFQGRDNRSRSRFLEKRV